MSRSSPSFLVRTRSMMIAARGSTMKPDVSPERNSPFKFRTFANPGISPFIHVTAPLSMNGLIPGLAKVRNLKGLFLSGETSGFMVDPRAAVIILKVLARKFALQIDMDELEKQAKEIEAALRKTGEKFSQQSTGSAEYIG